MFEVGMNHAVELLADKRANPGRRGGTAAKPLREMGEHPAGGALNIMEGRYGPYVKWEKVNATIPNDQDPKAITLEEAIALVDAKAGAKKKPKKAAAKKKPAKKATAKKKPAAKKKASAKSAATQDTTSDHLADE